MTTQYFHSKGERTGMHILQSRASVDQLYQPAPNKKGSPLRSTQGYVNINDEHNNGNHVESEVYNLPSSPIVNYHHLPQSDLSSDPGMRYRDHSINDWNSEPDMWYHGATPFSDAPPVQYQRDDFAPFPSMNSVPSLDSHVSPVTLESDSNFDCPESEAEFDLEARYFNGGGASKAITSAEALAGLGISLEDPAHSKPADEMLSVPRQLPMRANPRLQFDHQSSKVGEALAPMSAPLSSPSYVSQFFKPVSELRRETVHVQAPVHHRSTRVDHQQRIFRARYRQLPLPLIVKNKSISKMPLTRMYTLMGLGHDHMRAKLHERQIMAVVANEGFRVGYQTWVRDTPENERIRILEAIQEQTGLNYKPEILEIIVRRGTYARMQSALRQKRRVNALYDYEDEE